MHFTVITLFPDMFPGPLGHSLTGRALKEELWSLDVLPLRDFGIGKHKKVDDTPYGGGAGMVLRADVVDAALQAALQKHPEAQIIYFSPRGKAMDQPLLSSLASAPSPTSYILLCGRFEAIDERITDKYQPIEVSLGDFVMTGGELAAMALMDASVRLLPDVIGEAESLEQESFGLSQDYACLLEYPHYTAPPDWEGRTVPETLLSGHHSKISAWRKAQAEAVTKARRPDLWKKYTADRLKD